PIAHDGRYQLTAGRASRADTSHPDAVCRNSSCLGPGKPSPYPERRGACRPRDSCCEPATGRCVTNTFLKEEVGCCTRDEGGPLEASGQAGPQTPASCKLQAASCKLH